MEWKKLEEDEEALTTLSRNLDFIYLLDREPLTSWSKVRESQGCGAMDFLLTLQSRMRRKET